MKYAVALNYYNPADQSIGALYFCTENGFIFPEYDNSFQTSIDVSGMWFEPRLKQPCNFGTAMPFITSSSGGSVGEVELVNNDGALDYMAYYDYDGRDLYLFGIASDDVSIYLLGSFILEQLKCGMQTITCVIRDRLYYLETDFQLNKFLGNNIAPDGVEGSESLKDKPKPFLVGNCYAISPILVNASKLIYQLNDTRGDLVMNGIKGWYQVTIVARDGLVPYTRGQGGGDQDYSDLQDMYANEPGQGYFRMCFDGGLYIRLGQTPVETFTVDVIFNSYEGSVAGCITELFDKAGHTGQLYGLGNLPVTNYRAGMYVPETSGSSKSIIDDFLEPLLVSYTNDNWGDLYFHSLDVPSIADSVNIYIDPSSIKSIERVVNRGDSRGIPYKGIDIKYKKFYTVKTILSETYPDLAERFGKEFLSIYKEDPGIITRHPLAKKKELDTPLTDTNEADEFCDTVLAMFMTEREEVKIKLPLSELMPDRYPVLANYTTTPELAILGLTADQLLGTNPKKIFDGVQTVYCIADADGLNNCKIDLNTMVWSAWNCPLIPFEVGTDFGYLFNPYSYGAFIHDNIMYIANNDSIIWIDVTNPVAWSATPGNGVFVLAGMCTDGTYIYSTSYWSTGFRRIPLSNITGSWTDLKSYANVGFAPTIEYCNGYIYLFGVYMEIDENTFTYNTRIILTDPINNDWEGPPLFSSYGERDGFPPHHLVDGDNVVYMDNAINSEEFNGVIYTNTNFPTNGWMTADRYPSLPGYKTIGNAQYVFNGKLVMYNNKLVGVDVYGEIRMSLETKNSNTQKVAFSLGRIVNVEYPRYKWGNGKNFVLLGIQIDYQSDNATLTLWG